MSERIPSSEAPVQIAMVFGYNIPVYEWTGSDWVERK